MSDLTDEQQVEQLKAWWQENGRSLVIIVIAGIAGAIGYLKFQDHKVAQAESASTVFERAMAAADRGDTIILTERYEDLKNDFPDSPYVTQAGLRLAGVQLANGEADKAREELTTLLARERGSIMEPLVALRLARVALYSEDAQGALEVLDGTRPENFAPLFAEARGDAKLALGDEAGARDAYQQAIDNPGQPQLIDVAYVGIKLAELAVDDSADSP